MFAALLQSAVDQSLPPVNQDALQTLLDGIAQGNIVLAIVGGTILIALVVLGILKKDHPLIQPIAEILLKAARAFSKPKANPADRPGLDVVAPIKKLDQSEDK